MLIGARVRYPIKQIVLVVVLTAAVVLARPQSDPVIDGARDAAAAFMRSLPDYIVKRTTTRYRGNRANTSAPAINVGMWHQGDTVSGDVAAVQGKEVYTNIIINGKPAKNLPSGGAWSAGEFSSQVLTILSPERAARFTHQREESIRNRPAYRYDFEVDESHSVWNLAAAHVPGAPAPESYTTAYGGEIWIDKETRQVLRIEMSARDLPKWFPLDSTEMITDYDLVRIGTEQYVLPVRSVSLTCERSALICLKNDTVFKNYDKFSASSNITFDGSPK
jgi:hypothetical protein